MYILHTQQNSELRYQTANDCDIAAEGLAAVTTKVQHVLPTPSTQVFLMLWQSKGTVLLASAAGASVVLTPQATRSVL
jgi:hypothetical protein